MFVIEGINDLKTLSDVIGGELFSNNEPFTGITTDSREEVNGAVYLALKGESFDGDIFCKDAIDNGSIAVITDNPETLGRFILVKIHMMHFSRLQAIITNKSIREQLQLQGAMGKHQLRR